jgi:hypothetical protein
VIGKFHLFATDIDTCNDLSDYGGCLTLEEIAKTLSKFHPQSAEMAMVLPVGDLLCIGMYTYDPENGHNLVPWGCLTNNILESIQQIRKYYDNIEREKALANIRGTNALV